MPRFRWVWTLLHLLRMVCFSCVGFLFGSGLGLEIDWFIFSFTRPLGNCCFSSWYVLVCMFFSELIYFQINHLYPSLVLLFFMLVGFSCVVVLLVGLFFWVRFSRKLTYFQAGQQLLWQGAKKNVAAQHSMNGDSERVYKGILIE